MYVAPSYLILHWSASNHLSIWLVVHIESVLELMHLKCEIVNVHPIRIKGKREKALSLCRKFNSYGITVYTKEDNEHFLMDT